MSVEERDKENIVDQMGEDATDVTEPVTRGE
jgi:hypothetical protein